MSSLKRRDSFQAPPTPTLAASPSDTSISVIHQPRSSNIKVVGRFRPIVDYEKVTYIQVFTDSQEFITFINEKTVGIGQLKDLESFTLDRIFDPVSTQQEVFDFVGKPTIEDVMTGYNGTIFAYGQTGSGKTFTMMGYDIYDEDSRGIIPRASSQIFESVLSDNGEIEYTLKCSMLEIYKETIRDLLTAEPKSLRIKQCPRRGIYVQGLTEVCVTSERDMLEALTIGEQMRTVASTKLNQTSSRSHLIFILQVMQKLPNDSEKKGTLNLVDLAGSEKINNSGVTGNKLEEAKKINLSLSALGNVIHALIQNSDHVPYRDSKLTRLLQESLGGNYKTTLIVACSPSPKNQEETLNTMGFAIRAKNIKNKVKVNIKNSPENYMKLIEQLRNELSSAKSEIQYLRVERDTSGTDTKSHISSSRQSPAHVRNALMNAVRPISSRQISGEAKLLVSLEDLQSDENFQFEKKSHNSIFELDSLASSFNLIPERLNSDYETEQRENFQQIREGLEREMGKYKKRFYNLKKENKVLVEKNLDLEAKLSSSRTKQILSEQRANEYYENYHKTLMMINKDSTDNSILRRQNESLSIQVKRLVSNLHEVEIKFKNFIESLSNTKESTCVEFEDRTEMISRSDMPMMTECDDLDLEKSEYFDIKLSKVSLPIDPNMLFQASSYAKGLGGALEHNIELNKDITIYQLRNQVIQAGIINTNMTRAFYSLDWKLNLVNHKYFIKSFLCKKQQEQMKLLESMIEYLQTSYKKVVKLYESIELEQGKSSTAITNVESQKNKLLKPFTNKPVTPVAAVPRQRSGSRSNTVKHDVAFKKPDTSAFSLNSNDPDSQESSSFFIRYRNLETRFHMQEMYNFQLKSNNEQLKKQSMMNQEMLSKLEQDLFSSLKEERDKWKSSMNDMKDICEKELMRKQEEVTGLNQVLGSWITMYMDLQNKCKIPNAALSYEMYNKMQGLIQATITTAQLFELAPRFSSTRAQSPLKQSFTGLIRPSSMQFASKGDMSPPSL